MSDFLAELTDLSDLDDNVNTDIVKEPGSTSAGDPGVIIENKTPGVKKSETPLTPEQLLAITDSGTQFNIVTDGVSRIVELKEIQEQIISNESINQTDASYINDVFGNLFNNRLSLEEFTTLPSKTNFLYVKNFMRNKIAMEHEAAEVKFKRFVDSNLRLIHEALELTEINFTSSMTDMLSSV